MSFPFSEYSPSNFANVANTKQGQEIWQFLSTAESIRDMELASDLGHPAVAGIEERLLEAFNTEALEDRTKQMIGHMVRQIMEKRGFVIEQSNVTMSSVPFTKGTRYRRRDWYRIHVFRNSSDARDICFAPDRAGASLPDIGEHKWRYASSFATKLRAAIAFDVRDFDALRHELEEKGFLRTRHRRVLSGAN